MNIEQKIFEIETKFNSVLSTGGSISKIFDDNNIRYCIIGGLATVEYNYNKTTKDVDLIIDSADKDKFYELENRYYKPVVRGNLIKFYWIDTGVYFDIIFSDVSINKTFSQIKFEHPYQISVVRDGIRYITLEKLIEYKIMAGFEPGRLEDWGVVQKLILNNHLPYDFIDPIIRDDRVKEKYTELWNDVNSTAARALREYWEEFI